MNDDRDKMQAVPWVLASQCFNAVFVLWTFGGSLFILFLNELGLRKGQIGILLSLFPFCGLLALWFAPVAARLGLKRVFLACYGLRKLVMAALAVLPWLVVRGGHEAAMVLLCGVVATFAVLRALAETAYFPWSQEFIANRVRGRLAAWSNVLGLLASGVALAVAARVLDAGTGLGRYRVLIVAGSVIGLAGVAVMLKVPGGAPVREAAPSGTHRAGMRLALRDRNFTAYLAGLAGVTVGSGMLLAFLPLYVREHLGLRAATIVQLDLAVMVGGALASLLCGWLADRVGSRPVLMPAAALLVAVPLGWLLLPTGGAHAMAGAAVLYFAFGVASNGVIIGSGRLLYTSAVPMESRTAYMALYYAWLGVSGGIAPLLAGGILAACAGRSLRLGPITWDGYGLLFFVALLSLALGWRYFGRVRADGIHTTRTLTRSVIALRHNLGFVNEKSPHKPGSA
jgi:MFS family permease